MGVTLYKVLDDLHSCHGGHHKWTPGEWTPDIEPRVCERGWHLCHGTEQLLEWIGPQIWVAEARGSTVLADDKICVESCRIVRRLDGWNEATARLFACDCAERALQRDRDAGLEPDKRSWDAVRVARAFACGEATQGQLHAAWAAAWDASRAARNDDVWDDAWAAARAAAWDAACDTAWDAARDAARAAARADAWRAARAAARAAAWDATRAVAWDATCGSERKWQADKLHNLLHGGT